MGVSRYNFNIALITKDKGLALFSSIFSNTEINSRANGKIKITANIAYSIFHDDEDLLKTDEMWLKGEV
ncbi:MAG: hypothetical protein U9R27_03405 [Campylobacterota bacterium]|nr:hypothetical protein [Campylobacterota bacterium]